MTEAGPQVDLLYLAVESIQKKDYLRASKIIDKVKVQITILLNDQDADK